MRFLPQLEELTLTSTELTDLSPLTILKNLRELHLRDDEVEDLRCLAACANLRKLTLNVRQPWPRVEGLEKLEKLEEFDWSGNLLLLEGIPRLPAVREAKFTTGYHYSLPPRDCGRLPAMPLLRILELDPICRLEGIERWPLLRNLIVGGPIRDLRPLPGLR